MNVLISGKMYSFEFQSAFRELISSIHTGVRCVTGIVGKLVMDFIVVAFQLFSLDRPVAVLREKSGIDESRFSYV